jgi:hypothetical protein
MAKNQPTNVTADDLGLTDDEFTADTAELDQGSGVSAVDQADMDAPINWDEVETPKPLPNGWYRVSVIAANPAMSKGNDGSNGKPVTPPSKKIEVRLKVEGDGNGEPTQYNGRQIFDDISFAPGAMGFTRRAFEEMGITLSRQGVPELAEMMLHQVFDVMVGTQAGQNGYEPRNRIRKWRVVSSSELDEELAA